jgi:hypothetical protein
VLHLCAEGGVNPSSNSANAKKGASFDTEAVKQQIEAAQKKFHSQ